MPGKRRVYGSPFKAKVAELFADGRQRRPDQATDEQDLFEQIGRLKMEVEWLKKKLPRSAEVKRRCIEPHHQHLSVTRQCELVGLARSSWYYEPAGESPENLALMRQIDELYIKRPFFGTRKVCEQFAVNRKRAQVWASDITYIPLQHGFLYLAAVMDLYSRNVLSWRLSNTLTGDFCVEALDAALSCARPKIFNTDQGAQFTSAAFTSRLEKDGVAISMDGRGRAMDNVFVERLWRSVKYEEVYRRDYADGWEAEDSLGRYFDFYCNERIHQALSYRTPAEIYVEG